MKTTRSYTMRARAESTERTRTRILFAALELSAETPLTAITLPVLAQRAGVSVQTCLRQFGSRDGIIDAAVDYAANQEVQARTATPGDLDSILTALVDQYEAVGDRMLGLLAQEIWDTRAKTITDHGRAVHRQWVADVFAPRLAGVDDPQLLDLLVVATDLYTWKLLRRDRRLSMAETAGHMRRIINALLEK